MRSLIATAFAVFAFVLAGSTARASGIYERVLLDCKEQLLKSVLEGNVKASQKEALKKKFPDAKIHEGWKTFLTPNFTAAHLSGHAVRICELNEIKNRLNQRQFREVCPDLNAKAPNEFECYKNYLRLRPAPRYSAELLAAGTVVTILRAFSIEQKRNTDAVATAYYVDLIEFLLERFDSKFFESEVRNLTDVKEKIAAHSLLVTENEMLTKARTTMNTGVAKAISSLETAKGLDPATAKWLTEYLKVLKARAAKLPK
jgi:hypothetical protein